MDQIDPSICVLASALDAFISPQVVLPVLLCVALVGLFLWNDRQNRRRKP